MAAVINDLNGTFIGTVVGYDEDTRELDVFLPKLMPGIPFPQKDIEQPTNLGNSSVGILYNKSIISKSTLRVKAFDKNEPLPDIDSKIYVTFLEGRPSWGFWRKFNVNGDYTVIENEKYKKLHYIKIGGNTFEIEEDDTIEIELPEGFSVLKSEDTENKIKTFTISKDKETDNRITKLEKLVGTEKGLVSYIDLDGNEQFMEVYASGMNKKIESNLNEINKIYDIIGVEDIEYSYLEVENPTYKVGKKYFVMIDQSYVCLNDEMDEIFSLPEEKTKYMRDIENSGKKIYQQIQTNSEPTGFMARFLEIEKRLSRLGG